MESWEALLNDLEGELIDVESVLADLDDLGVLRLRVQAAEADGSIDQRPVLRRSAELIRNPAS